MSADPFAKTTTVKNILQHIISPKIVKSGGGYVTKTDLVNVHNLMFSETANTPGTALNPLTAQCGTVTMSRGGIEIVLHHSRITDNSIIIATCNTPLATAVESIGVNRGTKTFTITLLVAPGSDMTVSWFIAAF